MDKYRKERVEVTKRMIKAMKMMKLQGKKNDFIAEAFNVSTPTVSRYTGKRRVDMTLKKRSGRTTVGYTEYPTETLNSHNSMMASIGEVVMQNIVVWGVMTIIICLCLILIPWAMLSVRMIIGH